jgi:hypothetical protein
MSPASSGIAAPVSEFPSLAHRAYSTHRASTAYARFLVLSARTGLIGKDRKGSNFPVRRTVRQRPLLARSSRLEPT